MPLRVLIVDDSPVTRVMLSEMMEMKGNQVVAEAENMQAAIDAYKTHKPDLMLLDLALAQGDGISTLKSIRQIDPQARVVVISGNPQQKVRDEVMKSGALAMLNKPINMQELSDALGKVPNPAK